MDMKETRVFKRDTYLAGRLWLVGESVTFTVIEKPLNKFQGDWLRVQVDGYRYVERVYQHYFLPLCLNFLITD